MKTQLLLSSLLLALSGMTAHAAPFNWLGATDGNWGTGTNWDAAPVSATDTALVFDNANQLTTNNNIAGGLTLDSLTLTANSGNRVVNGNKLTFDGTAPTLTMVNTLGATGADDTTINTLIQMNQTLTLTGGVDFTHQLVFASAAVFSGAGGMTWSGGIGFISATNTYSGPTVIAGLLGVNKSGAFGSSASVTVQSGGALQIQGTTTINKPLSLAGAGFGSSATLNGSGAGTKTWSGAITLAGNASAGAYSGATLSLTNTVALGANSLTVDAGSTSFVSIFGAMTGAGGLTKIGAGTLILPSGANSVPTNTFSGPALISVGKLIVQRNSAFGASSLVTLAGGAEIELRSRTNGSGNPSGGATVTRPLLLGGKLSAGAPINNSDGFAEVWSGAVTLSGNATLSASGAGSFAVPSTLQMTGGIALGGFTLSLAPDGTSVRHVVQISSGITGTGAVDITTGSGEVALIGGTSTFTGLVSVNGNLSLGNGDNFGNVANSVTFTGGSVVTFTNIATIAARPFVITGAGGLVFVPGNFASTIGAHISGAGPVQFTGIGLGTGGVITLTGTNTFTGGMSVGSQTTVLFSSDSQLGAAGEPISLVGGGLFATADVTLSATRVLTVNSNNSGISAATGVILVVPNDITGTGRVVISGGSGGQLGGTVRLTGNNSQPGGTDIAGATLEVASDAKLGGLNGVLNIGRENGFTDIPGRLRALANLTIPATRSTTFRLATVDTNGFDVTFDQPISGQDLTKEGAGVLRFNTPNTFVSGVNDVVIQGGLIRSGVNEALGQPRIFLFGSTFDLNGFTQTVSTLTGSGSVQLGGGTLTLIGGSIIDAVISGAGTVNYGQTGFGPELYRILSDNTFTGTVAVTAGNRVTLKTTAAFGGAGNSVLLDNGGISSDSEATAPVVIGAAFPMTIGAGGASFGANGQSLVIESLLSGSAPIKVTGGGTGFEVRFANANNTFTSNINLGSSFSNVVLGIVADGSLGNAANILTLGFQFFDGEVTSVGSGTLRAFANLTLPPSRIIRLNGSLNGSSDMGGTFDTNGFNITVNGVISQLSSGMPLRKTGAGTLFLNGVNTYTGETTVSEGTLGGTGTIGAVLVEAGATLAPGTSPGTLHVGNVTFSDGSTLALDFASPSSADQLDVTGSVTLYGSVQLALNLGFASNGEVFTVIANDDSDAISGFFFSGANELIQGETFNVAGTNWTISYTGGTGNDVTLTASGASAPPSLVLSGFSIGAPTGGGSGIQAQGGITGPPGAVVRLERSSNLIDWTLLATITLNGSGLGVIDVTDPLATDRAFYMLIIP